MDLNITELESLDPETYPMRHRIRCHQLSLAERKQLLDWLCAHNLKGVWINMSFYTSPENASLIALKW